MAAKESEGLADGGTAPPTSASLAAAQEASIAGQYNPLDINGGKTGEEAEVSRFTSRFASLRDREERLAEIAAGLRLIKEKRGSRTPTYIELAAAVLLQDSVVAAIEGRPTIVVGRSLLE